MNLTSIRRFRAPAAALALGLALTACGAANEEPTGGSGEDNEASGLSGTLNGGGASSQEAAQNAWRAGFQEANPDVTVNYDPIGSGGGREQFISGGYFNRGQNTLYAMRWNPANPGTYQYATDVNWAYATARNLKNYYDQLGIRGQYYTRYTF